MRCALPAKQATRRYEHRRVGELAGHGCKLPQQGENLQSNRAWPAIQNLAHEVVELQQRLFNGYDQSDSGAYHGPHDFASDAEDGVFGRW